MQTTDRLDYLERAMALHRDGRLVDALALYNELLSELPNDADGLNLAADASFSQGDYAAAAEYFVRLAAVEPRDARARFNLGVAYTQANAPIEAAKAFQGAVDIDPAYPKGWFNLGVALERCQKLEDAAVAYERALAGDPGDAASIANLAGVFTNMRAFNRALALFDTAIGRWPNEPRVRLMHAKALRDIKLYDQAEDACRVALKLAPENADAGTALGLTLALAGKHAEAVTIIRQALEQDPDRRAAKSILAASLIEIAEFDEALSVSNAVLQANPAETGMLQIKARALQGLGRNGDAVEIFQMAFEGAPDDVATMAGYVEALRAAGRDAEVNDVFDAVIAVPPRSPEPYYDIAKRHLEAGEAEAAFRIVSQGVEKFPGDTGSLAIQGVAAAVVGYADIARTLNDFDGLMGRLRIAPPSGWKTVADFNAALAEHVENHPSVQFAPADHATQDGYHTGELMLEPMGPIRGLEETIRAAVDQYRRDHPFDPKHPFLRRASGKFGLNIWAIILKQAGHQVPHIHPGAWLSGVYYPKLPPVIGDNSQAGWIEFGRPPESYTRDNEPDVIMIRPEEGLMLLFPSYMYHRTIPFAGDGTRISIAFDVCPTS